MAHAVLQPRTDAGRKRRREREEREGGNEVDEGRGEGGVDSSGLLGRSRREGEGASDGRRDFWAQGPGRRARPHAAAAAFLLAAAGLCWPLLASARLSWSRLAALLGCCWPLLCAADPPLAAAGLSWPAVARQSQPAARLGQQIEAGRPCESLPVTPVAPITPPSARHTAAPRRCLLTPLDAPSAHSSPSPPGAMDLEAPAHSALASLAGCPRGPPQKAAPSSRRIRVSSALVAALTPTCAVSAMPCGLAAASHRPAVDYSNTPAPSPIAVVLLLNDAALQSRHACPGVAWRRRANVV